MSRLYDGSAHVAEYRLGGRSKISVSIEARNLRGEVYISRSQAREIRDRLNLILEPKSESAKR